MHFFIIRNDIKMRRFAVGLGPMATRSLDFIVAYTPSTKLCGRIEFLRQ